MIIADIRPRHETAARPYLCREVHLTTAPAPAPLQTIAGPSLDDVIARIRKVTERLRDAPTVCPAEMAADRVMAANKIDRELARLPA